MLSTERAPVGVAKAIWAIAIASARDLRPSESRAEKMSTRDAPISTRDALIEAFGLGAAPSGHAFIARERLAAQSDDDLKATHSRLKR